MKWKDAQHTPDSDILEENILVNKRRTEAWLQEKVLTKVCLHLSHSNLVFMHYLCS